MTEIKGDCLLMWRQAMPLDSHTAPDALVGGSPNPSLNAGFHPAATRSDER